jgi:3-phenylpropionate/trans-cinnamate dioxygenase ferredoxin reductase subunit
VTILGAGTIGTELASSVSTAGGEATLIDMAAQPLDRFFAGHLGTEAAAWIEAGRVGLHLGTKIEAVTQSGKAWIVTTSHDEVGADLVVSAVGTRPALAWLDNSDLDIANGVLCDPNGTAIDTVGRLIPNVHAIGDASAWTNTDGSVRRREDWTTAQRQGRHVARVLLGQAPVQEFNREPDYFWTHQFGRRIQILGTPQREADLVTQTEAAERNAAFYTLERNGEPVAWISVNAPREFGLAMQRSMSATH